MAEEELNPNEDAPETEPESGPSILSKIMIPLFVVGVIAAECAAAYVLLPDASQTQAMVEEVISGEDPTDKASGEDEELTEADLLNHFEIDLGEFDVTAFQPISQTTMRITFHLWGTIHEDDEAEFIDLKDANAQRLNEQMIVVIRGANAQDLADPDLGLIKRKLLDKVNKTVGKQLIKSIIISQFSYVEQ